MQRVEEDLRREQAELEIDNLLRLSRRERRALRVGRGGIARLRREAHGEERNARAQRLSVPLALPAPE